MPQGKTDGVAPALMRFLNRNLDLEFVKGGASTRMNKTDVLVIDIGTIRHGHRDGIFSRMALYILYDR